MPGNSINARAAVEAVANANPTIGLIGDVSIEFDYLFSIQLLTIRTFELISRYGNECL